MDSNPLKLHETNSKIFTPSRNIILLPAALSGTGLLLFLFFQFGNQTTSSETNFLGWGFIFVGLLGLVLNTVGIKKYRLCISDQYVRVYPNPTANFDIEIPLENLRQVKVQQSAIGKLLHYGNLSIQHGDNELFLQDIEQPEMIAELLSPQLKQTQA
jgi:uncharacterized membrane protein YdbT with pleckstrin-like domain